MIDGGNFTELPCFEKIFSVSRFDACECLFSEQENGWQSECEKMVSTILNEMRSLWADTVEPESCQPVSQQRLESTSIILTRWVFCFIYECFLIDLFRQFVFLMGVFIFVETFGILVKHSSGNSLL